MPNNNESTSFRTSLAIVVPCHNEEATVSAFYKATSEIANNELIKMGITVRYIFIDDGSSDSTLVKLRELSSIYPNVSFISFSRNFGKEAALFAGIKTASKTKGLCAVMDADLQDPPELLPQMIDKLLTEKCDRVAAYRVSRDGEPPIRSWFAHRFYRLMNRLTNLNLRDGARDFSVMTPRFIEAVLSCSEYNRFTKGLFGWVGYPTEWISYKNVERVAGETNWSFWSLLRYAFDGIVAYSTKPLEALSLIGGGISIIAVIALIVVVIRALLFGDPVAGWPSLMAILLLMGGILTFGLGILGYYLSKIYLEVKKRPIYLIKETSDDDWIK